MLNPELIRENESLRCSWDRYTPEHLDSYLVQSVEDPRINCQSILTRALMIDTLWPDQSNELIDAELRFGAAMTWMTQRRNQGASRAEILEGLEDRDDSIPKFAIETFAWLESENCPISNYMIEALLEKDLDRPEQLLGDRALNTFAHLWGAEFSRRERAKISVLEPACGSANDFRYLDACGLAGFLDYTGFDISTKNINNAQGRFPGTSFLVASVYDTGMADESADYVFTHDLFEHLSPEGLEVALGETMRLARKQAWLHFFNLHEIGRHEFHRVEGYYWNKLSLGEIRESLKAHASEIEIIKIPQLLKDKFGCEDYYNQEAVTILATK